MWPNELILKTKDSLIPREYKDVQRDRQPTDANIAGIRGPTDSTLPTIHVHLTSEPSESSEVVNDDGLLLLERTKQSEGVQFDHNVLTGIGMLMTTTPEHHDLDLDLDLDQRLRHALKKCKGDEDKYYMPIDELEKIICHETVKSYLLSMDQAGLSNRHQELTTYICGNCDKSEELHTAKRVFASLILANRADAITMLHDEGIRDEDLPLVQDPRGGSTFELKRKNTGESILGRSRDWEHRDIQIFDRHQWEMKPPFFAQGHNSRPLHYRLSDRSCLPWTIYEKIHSSRNSEVRHVGIHPAQHRLPPKVSIVWSAALTCLSDSR